MGDDVTSTSFPLVMPIEFGDVFDKIYARLRNRFTTPYYTEYGGNIDKLMLVLAVPLAELRDCEDDILAAHKLSEATGYSLDQWGVLLQLYRNTGEADDLYRSRLITQSLIRRRSATPQDMVSTCAGVLGVGTDRVTFVDSATPATFSIDVFLVDILNAGITLSDFRDMMDTAKAGGVDRTMIIEVVGSFSHMGIGGTSDSTKGYNNIANDNPTGGRYSGMI